MRPSTLVSVLVALACVTGAGRVLAEAPTAAPRDTLIPAHVPYKGYRLHVRDAQLLKQRKDRYYVSLKVVNTGAQSIGLGPGFPVHFLQTAFDDALAQSGLLPLAPGIRAALIREAIALEPGGSLEDFACWITAETAAATPIARTDDIAPAYRERLPQKREPRPRPSAEGDALYASAKPVPPPPTPQADRCADLKVGGIEVLQRDKRSALVQLTLVNVGPEPLTREALGTGATLDVYLGGGERVTAASKRLARVNLSARIGSSLGRGLAQGASLQLTERLDLASLTRYTRVLVAQLDPGQVITECDETNNEASVVLKR